MLKKQTKIQTINRATMDQDKSTLKKKNPHGKCWIKLNGRSINID